MQDREQKSSRTLYFLARRGSLQCELCGVEHNRRNVTNECPYGEEERSKVKEWLGVGLKKTWMIGLLQHITT